MVLNFQKSICCVRHELLGDPGARTETSKIDFFAVNYPPITTVPRHDGRGPQISRDIRNTHIESSKWLWINAVNTHQFMLLDVTRTICCGFLREHPALWGWVKTLVPFVNPKS